MTTTALVPVAEPRAPGYGRAFGRVTVFGAAYGRTVPLAGALVRPYVPGTATPWPDPLYLDEADATAAVFPVATDASGAVALWADAEGRVELVCEATGYAAQRLVLDLEPPPDAAGGGGGGEPYYLGAVFDVQAHGALGDGVADDTAALQATITACQAAGGGTVYVPPGTYHVSSTLEVTASSVVVRGAGDASRLYRASGASGPLLRFQGAWPAAPLRWCAVEHLTLTGPSGHGAGCLVFSSTLDSLILGCRMQHSNGPGIVLQDVSFANRILSTFVHQNNGGVVLRDNANNVSLVGCRIQGNSGVGLRFDTLSQPASGVTLVGTDIEGNGNEGILVGATSVVTGLTVHGCYFEVNNATGPPGAHITVLETVNGFSGFDIRGCTFAGGGNPNNARPIDLRVGGNGAIGPNTSTGHAVSERPLLAAGVIAVTVQDGMNAAPGEAAHGLTIRGTSTNTRNASLALTNPASGGGTWGLYSGIPGVSEGGFALRDATADRTVLTASGATGVVDFATPPTVGGLPITGGGISQADADTRYVNATDPAGDSMAGPLTVAGTLRTNAEAHIAALGGATLRLYAQGGAPRSLIGTDYLSGGARWDLRLGGSGAETGSDAGSDFALVRHSDAGAALGTALSVSRATGAAAFGGAVTAGGNLTVTTAGQTLLVAAGGYGPAVSTSGALNLGLAPGGGFVVGSGPSATNMGHPDVRWGGGYFDALVLGAAPVALGGTIRLRNGAGGTLAWRNAGNTADLTLGVDGTNSLVFDGTRVPKITVAASAPSSPATGDLWVW